METIKKTDFASHVEKYIAKVIKTDERLRIETEEGCAILLSEERYLGLKETLHLLSIPGMKEKILAATAEKIEDCVPEKDMAW